MIDSEFIIRYTNALYAVPLEFCPRYNEFRDMFSAGQIKSKEWLIREICNIDYTFNNATIVGSWFGTLGVLLSKKFPSIDIEMIDIDKRCKYFVDNIIYDNIKLSTKTYDMFEYNYITDIVINTNCEHIKDVSKWLNLIKKDSIVVLQSNNYFGGNDHINCVNNIDEFSNICNLSQILYSGTLQTSMYDRFMIIGKI
jgi:hypothetical protein